MLKIPEVDTTYSLAGTGFSGNIANNGISYVVFKPWGDRKTQEQSAQAILDRVQGSLSKITEASVFTFARLQEK
jgi:multidrug efflux pump subunit AcrB